ncbi:MAG: hypothetical protein HN359_07295, partial [Actinobacteria bacterium]|nr:hypothetical protein [Actinomycetota bacterium]MBT4786593.1 hypothetical protein [Actinomycetota bacterium]
MRGNTILGAVLATLALLAIGVLVALAAPGDLDTSFSADGMVTTDIGSADSGRAVAVQSDGKIVVVG